MFRNTFACVHFHSKSKNTRPHFLNFHFWSHDTVRPYPRLPTTDVVFTPFLPPTTGVFTIHTSNRRPLRLLYLRPPPSSVFLPPTIVIITIPTCYRPQPSSSAPFQYIKVNTRIFLHLSLDSWICWCLPSSSNSFWKNVRSVDFSML